MVLKSQDQEHAGEAAEKLFTFYKNKPTNVDQKEIQSLVESVIDKRKSISVAYQIGKYFKPGEEYAEPEYPDYYPTYAIAVELAEENRWHAEKGAFPAKLFKNKSPMQTQDEYDYIKNNYPQVTLPVGIDFINTIARAFNDGNYKIQYPKEEGTVLKNAEMDLQTYLQKGIYIYGSLENFMKFTLPAIKTVDANGVIAVKPILKYSENGNGEKTIDSTQLNEPQPYYYDCSKIVAFQDEKYALIDVTSYDYVSANNEKKKSKKQKPVSILAYEFYDENAIWQIEYDVEQQSIIKFEKYYEHNWNRLPVEKIKGIPRIMNGEVIWQSIFSFATGLLNLVALNQSSLQIIVNKCAYPTRVYVGSACAFEYKDSEGNITNCAGTGFVYDSHLKKNITCPGCNGTKLQGRFSPLHDYIVNPGDLLNPGDKMIGTKPFYYEAPSTEIMKELRDYIDTTDEKARKILHIHTSNSQVRGSVDMTATGTAIDQKQMYAFIKPISDQMFDTWQFIADAISWMRYGENAKYIAITKPVTFDFNTEFDYIFELSEVVKAGFPPFVVQAILERYLNSYFFTSEKIVKSFQLIIESDRLMGLDLDHIATQQAKGNIAGWEVILHCSAISLINNIILLNEKFFDQDLIKQKEQLIAEAKRIESDNAAAGQNNTQATIQAILANGKAKQQAAA